MKVILASKSPRRKEIFGAYAEKCVFSFDIITRETDEELFGEHPVTGVRTLAERKGAAVADKIINMIKTEGAFDGEDTLVLSSDTVVAAGGEILGKPRDLDDARDMLRRIEGKDHSVFSGIAVALIKGGEVVKTASAVEETVVRFSPMTDGEIEFYVNHENVLDKAGAYAIQGIASAWIEGIDGDYFNVVGLPVRRLMRLFLDEFGLTLEMLRSDV